MQQTTTQKQEIKLWHSKNIMQVPSVRCQSLFRSYRIFQSIRCTMIFSLGILEKNNDECTLILVIYWKITGLLHTKISNHNIIYSSQKPRKSSSLPLKSSSWLFSLDASLSSYKMSPSLPSSALLMPHF